MSAFLVPTDMDGYIVDKVEHKLGQGASDTCALRFEDLILDEGLRLGEEGEGYRIALSNLETGRIGIAAQCVGMAGAALAIATRYAKERTSCGKALMEHQAMKAPPTSSGWSSLGPFDLQRRRRALQWPKAVETSSRMTPRSATVL